MSWPILALLSLLPLLGFWAALRFSNGRFVIPVLVAAVIGAALGAWLAIQNTIVATAVSPIDVRVRGATIGFAAGAVLGCAAAAVTWAHRARS
jgi:hypothetical protein